MKGYMARYETKKRFWTVRYTDKEQHEEWQQTDYAFLHPEISLSWEKKKILRSLLSTSIYLVSRFLKSLIIVITCNMNMTKEQG